MGKIFHEKAMKLAVEQGYGSFQTIKLLAMKARQKQRAVHKRQQSHSAGWI